MKPGVGMNIHFLQHVAYEGPGALEDWCKEQRHSYAVSKMYERPSLPEIADLDMLIIMGGPMGVYDEDKLPWLKDEKHFISRCLDEQIKCVGICLGAQLLAESLGAEVYPHSCREIGWFPVSWSREFREQPAFGELPEQQTVLHWHGDTYDLPEGAMKIASSAACEQQGFLWNDQALALQFHLEMQPANLEALIGHSDLEKGSDYVQNKQQMLADHQPFNQCNRQLFSLLDNFMKLHKSSF